MPVYGDPDRLTQVAANLLANACKFTPEGGEVDLRLECSGGEVVLRVSDTGAGIPPGELTRIFQTFVQLAAHSGPKTGLGLGLPLVAELVRLHGGRVRAESDGVGRGSEFIVNLPLADVDGNC